MLTRRASRRQLLGLGALAVAAAGSSGLLGFSRGVWQMEQAWASAALPNDEFLAQHRRSFGLISLGCSFAPEQWSRDELRRAEPLAGLRFAVEELGMRQVRLGFRWNRVAQRNGGIDLRYYKPYFDYCLNEGVDIAFNLGPIRTFRWPEDHVPGFILRDTPFPPQKGRVEAGSPLALAGHRYIDALFDHLLAEYSAADLAPISTLQPENEPFFHIGEHLWVLTPAHVRRVMDHLDDRLPGRDLLVASAGRLDLRAIRDLFYDTLRDDDRYKGRLVSGFDYHFRTPTRDAVPVIRHLDPVAFALRLTDSPETHRDDARRIGFRIEVTEAQAEPNGYLTTPGNSAHEFRFMLARCAEAVLAPRSPSLIRLWGIEELAKRAHKGQMTDDHRQIVDLVQAINGRSESSQEA